MMPGRKRRVHFQELSDFERGRLVRLLEAGLSAVVRWWRRGSEQRCHTRRRETEAHRLTDECIIQHITKITVLRRTSNASKIRSSVALEMTVRTIRNRLLETGIRARGPLSCYL